MKRVLTHRTASTQTPVNPSVINLAPKLANKGLTMRFTGEKLPNYSEQR